ncbi:hypothetical protein EDB80DRAFT_741945 [Ilyonectria destructans]|nr:hypothetical protein EDB80DRAFT_741945 [Ilyonectria destructans]
MMAGAWDTPEMRNPITRIHGFATAFGVMRWMFAVMILGFSAFTVQGATIPKIKPPASFLVACATLHAVVLWYPMTRPVSRTDPSASRLCIIAMAVMSIAWAAAIAAGSAMVVFTKDHRNAPTWPGHKCSPDQVKCFAPNDNSMSWLCMLLSALTLILSFVQLCLVWGLRLCSFTPEIIQEAFELSKPEHRSGFALAIEAPFRRMYRALGDGDGRVM